MCIVAWCQHLHPSFPFILIANRDEFLTRETTPLSDTVFEHTFAGKDVRGGGTWLAINELGYFGALTNLRVPFDQLKTENTKSRGAIIVDYLDNTVKSSWTTEQLNSFLISLHQEREFYNDYNLVCGNTSDTSTLYYGSHNTVRTAEDAVMNLKPGKVYCVSNASLHDLTPWPKTNKLQNYLKSAVETFNSHSFVLDSSSLDSFSYQFKNQKQHSHKSTSHASHSFLEHLFEALNDGHRLPPDDPQLPITGIGLEWDQWLSSVFVERGPQEAPYGTRSQCVLLMDKNNVVTVIERTLKLPSLMLPGTSPTANATVKGSKEVEDDRGVWVQTWYQFPVQQNNNNKS